MEYYIYFILILVALPWGFAFMKALQFPGGMNFFLLAALRAVLVGLGLGALVGWIGSFFYDGQYLTSTLLGFLIGVLILGFTLSIAGFVIYSNISEQKEDYKLGNVLVKEDADPNILDDMDVK